MRSSYKCTKFYFIIIYGTKLFKELPASRHRKSAWHNINNLYLAEKLKTWKKSYSCCLYCLFFPVMTTVMNSILFCRKDLSINQFFWIILSLLTYRLSEVGPIQQEGSVVLLFTIQGSIPTWLMKEAHRIWRLRLARKWSWKIVWLWSVPAMIAYLIYLTEPQWPMVSTMLPNNTGYLIPGPIPYK